MAELDNLFAGIQGLQPAAGEGRQTRNALGQQEFFDLMVAQLQNQDPLNPTDSAEFLSQVAQFSTVNGINQMQQSIATLAEAMTSSQALQASMLVGGDVLVSSRAGFLQTGKNMEGAIDLPSAAGQVVAQIFTPSGQLVRELQLGPQDRGLVQFAWDGQDRAAAGSSAPARSGRAAKSEWAQLSRRSAASRAIVLTSRDSIPAR